MIMNMITVAAEGFLTANYKTKKTTKIDYLC